MANSKRFAVALSFPGRHRQFIKRISETLAREFGQERILYDEYHEHEFAGLNLDTHLQRLYHDEAELIAVFLGSDYDNNQWCGLEWRAIRDLIKRREESIVMAFRFDMAEIPGLFSIDGYSWIGDRPPETIAQLIIERMRLPASATHRAGLKAFQLEGSPYRPPLVISACHAAGSDWEKNLVETLASHGVRHRSYTPKRSGWIAIFRRNSRQKAVSDFYEFYRKLIQEHISGLDLTNYRARPSIIAYHVDSYIVGRAMQKYTDIKFDKIILCGSILATDFDWSTLFHRDQVNFVRNEYGQQSRWTSTLTSFVENAGASGSDGFRSLSTVVSQERFEYHNHGDYFHPTHVENFWLPTLGKEPSPLQVRHGRNMRGELDEFVATLNATHAIDEQCFAGFPEFAQSNIPRGLSTTWIEINPDIYTFLFDRRTEKVCGYINAMPIDDACFAKVSTGELRDNEIKSNNLIPFLEDQTLKLYLMSIAIDPALRRANQGLLQEPLERLLSGFIGKLYYYAANHRIRVTEVVAIAWTPVGKKLCEALGMTAKGQDKDGHPIYWLDFTAGHVNPARGVLPGVKKLTETYNRMAGARAT